LNTIIKVYRFLFARKIFYKLNKFLFRCSLSGLGILNYESDKVSGEDSFLRRYLKNKKDVVIIDVGANVGNYSKKVMEINSSAIVYAFEPHPKSYTKLKMAIKSENFHPINSAVSDHAEVLALYDYEVLDGSAHASLYQDVIENIHHEKSCKHEVQTIILSEFFSANNISEVGLLKIDTEGNELKVLMGITEFIESGKIRLIHFEFNEMNVSSKVYFRDFWNMLSNYHLYRLLPSGMIKIENYRPVYCELFAYQNIVAVLKDYDPFG